MKTFAQLAAQSFRFDTSIKTHLVVSFLAPPLDEKAKRPPVCVIPVVDISGSMQGAKLQQAKQSVMKLISHLGPQDRCGVVVFSSEATVVSPPVEMTANAKADLKLRIGDLRVEGNTDLAGGMLTGLKLANLAVLPEGMLVRVILFTDGHANAGGATTSAQLLPMLDARRDRATLSAFGYGRDADQELLSDLANRGGGNYAFVATPDDASSAFARELGGLLSTYATDLEVRIVAAPGVVVRSVLSDVDARQQGGELVLRMDELLAEEERHLVLQVDLDPCREPATLPAFQVTGTYTRRAGGAEEEVRFSHAVEMDRVEARLAFSQPLQELDVIIAQAELLRAQLDAEEQARAGDYQGAVKTLFQMADNLEARGHDGAAKAARAMSSKMRDAAAFEDSGSYRKSMQAGLRRGSTSALEGEAGTHLRRMGKKVSTKAQQDMDDSFGKSPTSATPPTRPDPDARPSGGGVNRRRSRRW